MQMSTGISIASLVVSVITLALVLMLLAGKPWESSQVELEMSQGISEAQRLDACAAMGSVFNVDGFWRNAVAYPAGVPVTEAILENRCTKAELKAILKDAD